MSLVNITFGRQGLSVKGRENLGGGQQKAKRCVLVFPDMEEI
jgi:hypothetical protein